MLPRKVRQRRLALLKARSASEEDSSVEGSQSIPLVTQPKSLTSNVQPSTKDQIETVAEVLTEIPENVKKELQRKKKLTERKKQSAQADEDNTCFIEVIQGDVESDNAFSNPDYRVHEDVDISSPEHPSFNENWFSSDSPNKGHDSDRRKISRGMLSPVRQAGEFSTFSEITTYSREQEERSTFIDVPSTFENDSAIDTPVKANPRTRRRNIVRRKDVSSPSTLATASSISVREVSEEEAFNFFTRVWSEEEEVKSRSHPEPRVNPDIPEIVVTDGQNDEAVFLRTEYFENDSDGFITREVKSEYISDDEKVENEKDIYFSPSMTKVPDSNKLPEGMTPSTTEKIRVPYVPIWTKNILENRLVKQNELRWFDDDASVKTLPDPTSKVPAYCLLLDDEQARMQGEVMYVKADIPRSCHQHLRKKNSNTLYQLDLDVSSISFTHHPLFSKEHVLASNLIQMCRKFIACTEQNIIPALKQKIKALRFALRQAPLANRADMSPARRTRYKIYKNEVRQTRRLRDATEAEQNNLLNRITSCWDELKALREKQGYINTTVKIEIHEEPMDESVEKEEWDRELRHELEDEKEEFDFYCESALRDYNHSLLLWKEWHRAYKQASKRQRKRETTSKGGQSEGETSPKSTYEPSELEDERILSEPEKPKPKVPPKFETKDVINQLLENALKMRRKPGEPKVFIKLEEYGLVITPTDQCLKEESQRRNDVSKTKLHFKIMYNEKKVSETTPKSLTQDFNAFWGQIFKLHIVHYPQSFKLEIYESYKSRKITLAEVYIPIPDITQTAVTAQLIDHQFSSDLAVPSLQHAVGSAVQYTYLNGERTWLLTNGIVKCSLAWGVGEDNLALAPSKIEEEISLLRRQKILSPLGKLFSENVSSLSKLRERVKKLQLDVYDPSNADLLETIYEYGLDKNEVNSEGTNGYFRLEPFEDSLNFVPFEEIDSNPRFRLLQLRNEDVSEFRNLQMIPADSKNLSHELLELLQKKSTKEDDAEKTDSKPQRDSAHQLRQKVRNEVAKRFYISQHQRTLEDIVYEEKVPNIGTLGFGLLKLFKRKRPLYPVRKERKKVTGQAVANSEVRIMVSVLHAMNVPVRTDVDPLMERMRRRASVHTDPDPGFESVVRPFVEVMFQRVAMKTTVAEGPHPTWNQELCLPFRAVDDDFSPQNLERVKDVIYFNLFDEVTVDLLEDDSDRESIVHQRLERRWLGNLKIPFTTLYLNSKIEGTFCLNAPLVQLGYESEQRPWLTGDAQDLARNTYLSLFITIEPCLQLPEVFREKYDTGESDRILHEVERWQQTLAPRFPERLMKLMTVDLRGKWIFVTRFLHPISPPNELMIAGKESLETLEMLARFVSLIPTVSDSVIYPGLCDIWSTCDQFLQMLTGDQEEHAITLCNFFLYLGKKAMLLLGSGIPEGPTAYVLTWEENNEVWAWNASSGSHFNVRDSHSPLQRVGCLIGLDNIWANIQKSDHPSRIHFDLSKSSDWKSFFNKSFPNPGLKSVQPEALTYTQTDPEFVQKLQDKLKQSLQENIMKWRRKHCTSWNNYCNQVLFKILTRLERNAGRTASIDSLQELEQILSSHKLSGFPLTMPYTDIDAVIETVFSTGVHLTEGKNVEFSLAVYVHPYPSSVLAVWVYVAVLVSRRDIEVE